MPTRGMGEIGFIWLFMIISGIGLWLFNGAKGAKKTKPKPKARKGSTSDVYPYLTPVVVDRLVDTMPTGGTKPKPKAAAKKPAKAKSARASRSKRSR